MATFSSSPLPLNPTGYVYLFRSLGNLVSYLKLLVLVLVVIGQNPAILLGLDPPQTWTRTWTWSQENKVGLSVSLFKHLGHRSNWAPWVDQSVSPAELCCSGPDTGPGLGSCCLKLNEQPVVV